MQCPFRKLAEGNETPLRRCVSRARHDRRVTATDQHGLPTRQARGVALRYEQLRQVRQRRLDRLKQSWGGPVAYPVAVAVAAAGHDIPLGAALAAFLQALVANWVSAGVRLVPLGQTDGQRVVAALEPAVAATAQRALVTALDDMGGSAFRADLASLRHETQYTRLFRS